MLKFKYLQLFLGLFSFSIYSQSYLKITTISDINLLAENLIVANFQNIKPKIKTQNYRLYEYAVASPTNIVVIINRETHWFETLWINPNNDTVEIEINYKLQTAKLLHPKKWDEVSQMFYYYFNKENVIKADSIAKKYILQNPKSYLGLWLLAHGACYTNTKLKSMLFGKLDASLKYFKEYNEIYTELSLKKIPKVGESLVDFSLMDISKKPFSSNKIAPNKMVLMHFWSNSCGPCVKGMDDLVETFNTIDTSKIEIISVCLDEEEKQWKDSKTSQKIKWQNLWQQGGFYGSLFLNYNVRAMPTFVFFSKEKTYQFAIEGEDLVTIKSEINNLTMAE